LYHDAVKRHVATSIRTVLMCTSLMNAKIHMTRWCVWNSRY